MKLQAVLLITFTAIWRTYSNSFDDGAWSKGPLMHFHVILFPITTTGYARNIQNRVDACVHALASI